MNEHHQAMREHYHKMQAHYQAMCGRQVAMGEHHEALRAHYQAMRELHHATRESRQSPGQPVEEVRDPHIVLDQSQRTGRNGEQAMVVKKQALMGLASALLISADALMKQKQPG